MSRAVIYDDVIWVIGGMGNVGDGPYYLDTIHAIDSRRGTVRLLDDTLPLEAFDVAAVVADHKIYAFGGFNGDYIDSIFCALVTERGVLRYRQIGHFCDGPFRSSLLNTK